MTKPYNGSTLRDWFSIDDVLWKPLWLLPNEKDPQEVIMVPLNSNGTFTLFGFTFENKSKNLETRLLTRRVQHVIQLKSRVKSENMMNRKRIQKTILLQALVSLMIAKL